MLVILCVKQIWFIFQEAGKEGGLVDIFSAFYFID